MQKYRNIRFMKQSTPTMEGAGVKLKRVFSQPEAELLDPFLLLDNFGSSNYKDYILGFPYHPHRGIETITYMLQGEVDHKDSLGNGGTIHPGDVQWMTAGSGIIHEEMPQKSEGGLRGFQLWANLPSTHKMMDPRYRDVRKNDIPLVSPQEGVEIRIVSGKIGGVEGPVKDIVIKPEYYDITLEPHTTYEHQVAPEHTVFAYLFQGKGYFEEKLEQLISSDRLIVFSPGDTVKITSNDEMMRFLLVSGQPIREYIAWRGPIVMNSHEELRLAFEEYRNGTFLKHQQS